ncbi:ZP4 protein, partial [Polypterus senegalus]
MTCMASLIITEVIIDAQPPLSQHISIAMHSKQNRKHSGMYEGDIFTSTSLGQARAEAPAVASSAVVGEEHRMTVEFPLVQDPTYGTMCPYAGDNYLTSLVTVDSTSGVAYPSHYKRFVFEMFAFVDPVARQALAEKGYQYVVTVAVGTRSNVKTFTCQKPVRRSGSVAKRCTVADGEKLPCGGSSSITQADCEANNCCYDSSSSTSPCYYANDVTVQCTLDGQFVVVVSMNVTLPPLDLGFLQLVDSSSIGCSPVTSLSSFVMYQFPVSACGSTVQLAGGNVTYQNALSAAITVRTGPDGSITRDSVYKLFFQCTYSGSQDVQVEAEVYTVAPPLPVVEQGPFDLELVIATDSSYGSYYVDADYPVTKTLRDPVAVEVHIVNRTDPNLVLTLGDCWVTPGPSASSQPQWSLLVNGCPNTGDNYLTSLVTVDSTSGVAYPSHYKRFVFEMFAFVDPVAQQALAEKVGFLAKARRSGSVAKRCTVADGEKLPCGGSSSITQADCEVNNCCYDSSSSTSPCYYANDVTVQCTLDGQFVVVVSMNVTLPPLDLGSLQLVDSSSIGCSPVTRLSSFVMYQFPVSACGSTVQLAGGNVTYQNTMSAAITVRSGPDGSITRDSVYKLFFQCTYSGSQDVQVEAEVYTVAPPLPVVEQGPFDLELVIATDSSYGSYYGDVDYPVTKTLRDPVAVEVHIVNRTDPNLVLTLGDCWVTPGPSASSQPQWSLLVNGCPNTGDNYLSSLVIVDSTSGVAYPSHYKRFVFEMFAFVDPLTQKALAEKVASLATRRSGSVAERCTVADGEKLLCGGSSSITQADCEANNCCYDSSSSTSPCYYANDVTVQCTLDGQFVVVVSENVTLPPLDLGSIQLVDSSSPSCSPVTSLSSFVMYQFPVSACGSTVQMAGGNVTYQNTMSAAIAVRTGPEGSITRDSVYKLFFQCTYSGSQDVQVEAEVYTVAPPLPVVEQGPFDLELVIATDSSYGSYYVDADYPVTKTLRDPVAVEVHIVNRTDPNLVLTLGDCWVTPGPSASSQPQWSLLVNGCPYTGDNYLTSLVTLDSTSGVTYPSHYKRFVFEMFAFVDPVAQQALAEKFSSLSTAPARSQVSLGTVMDDCLFINGLSVLNVYSAAHQHNEILTGSVQDNI